MSENPITPPSATLPVAAGGKIKFGMRVRISLTFFVFTAVVSGLIAFFSYRLLSDQLFRELQDKVLNLSKVGAQVLDKEALARLVADLAKDPEGKEADSIEKGQDYAELSRQLNAIRDVEPKLVRYVYLFVPTDDPDHARYLVDADVLDLLERQARGEAVSDDDISSFASDFDVSQYPVARDSMARAVPDVEDAYSWDDSFKVNSVSGYSPVMDRNGKPLAWLGLDMTDSDVRVSLASATTTSLIITMIALVLSLAASILLGGLFTKGIVHLDRIVARFGDKDFGARAQVLSNDEVGNLGRRFNQMAETIQDYSAQLQALLDAYSRFVPQDFLHFLEKGSILDVHLGDMVQREMSVLFCDIRSFTSLSESMSPEENFVFLNSYLKRIGPVIRRHGGFIDKYVGDAVMALFPRNPQDALEAAVAMMATVKEYNSDRGKAGYSPISIGIGVNTGTLMLGTLGEDRRMDGSVISDAVNLSSRLESLTRYYGATILTTDLTMGAATDPGHFERRLIDRVKVKGRREAVVITEILDGEAPESRASKRRSQTAFNQALDAYYSQEFEDALGLFQDLHKAYPADRVFEIYEERCVAYIAHRPGAGWDGVQIFDFK